jgi:hypothetical protein
MRLFDRCAHGGRNYTELVVERTVEMGELNDCQRWGKMLDECA